ncbi:MAG: Sec-independent protein translocase subunit TatA/TatB [Planctomycetota bacterium]
MMNYWLLGYTIGWMELVIVCMVVLLLFGTRLPSVMRNMGRGIVEFKKGMQGITDESDSSASSATSERQSEHKPASPV